MLVDGKEYEILIRRQGEEGYSAFCPQLELIVRGTAHVQVEEKMKQLILQHVKGLDGNAGSANESPQG
jgi:hypothetical protein